MHGLNLVWKIDPYVPPATRAGFRGRDARWFARHGFNGARVGTLWAGAHPGRGRGWAIRRTSASGSG